MESVQTVAAICRAAEAVFDNQGACVRGGVDSVIHCRGVLVKV